ncbi:hypothetical protein [Patiriisocius sp. Uisw_017]|uniref:hypothetical protein n=1 Tax=Patiriisocius sp. Uisw_017 TaxID=3230968 RepID=UPI0039EAEA68
MKIKKASINTQKGASGWNTKSFQELANPILFLRVKTQLKTNKKRIKVWLFFRY